MAVLEQTFVNLDAATSLVRSSYRSFKVVDLNTLIMTWSEISRNACVNEVTPLTVTPSLLLIHHGRAAEWLICSFWCHLLCCIQSKTIFRTLQELNISDVLSTIIVILQIKEIVGNRKKCNSKAVFPWENVLILQWVTLPRGRRGWWD